MELRRRIDQVMVWGNTQPILPLRRAIWIVTGGIWLCAAYCVAAVGMLLTIVFAPFALQVLRISLFALDGGITLEPYIKTLSFSVQGGSFLDNPAHPYTIAGNIVWALLFGWPLVLAHLSAALIQALTIVGLSTAILNVKMATYVIWPFGRSLRERALPTTLEELDRLREERAVEKSTQRLYASNV
ncbi:hypothetical protein ACKKBG_A07580 [Auxenochlorella protothecoides x Auxenochlorella symbiontica]|uniref:Inner membrane component domain-containing protein n=2 Tax=Auxenochlorella protothecoides TaxID=3075 RepID=A0A087SN51_AUXPR|nr:hypothetical protein F751_1328 [Auxenochlorella protothecoides]KFM27155.1 hypothetical protein F751_1328 [Auxenochlorella protothecoides]